VVQPWLRFHIPLIESDVQISAALPRRTPKADMRGPELLLRNMSK